MVHFKDYMKKIIEAKINKLFKTYKIRMFFLSILDIIKKLLQN